MKSALRWYQRHQLFNQSVDTAFYPWLFDSSSLTARLVSLCGKGFNVQVISQHWQKIDAEERFAMSLGQVNAALVRQVLLCCDEQPLVYARTVIPATTLTGRERRYANMGNRPLGAMLFADRTMQRDAVQVCRLPGEHLAYQYSTSGRPIWGRRSVFRVSGKPLLVSEFFLPELLAKQPGA